MTIVAVFENTRPGAIALRTAADEAALRNTNLIVVASLSGSTQPASRGMEEAAVRAQITSVLGADGWTLELVEHGADHVGVLVEYIHRLTPTRVVIGTQHRSAVGKLLLEHDHRRLLLEIDEPIVLVKLADRN